ncbi:MAG TPA: radical SAM/SPASM domain-containing protein [Candidatus Wujingus californicus]|uniref:radical SAM/SPASM domain-containing protein n=1 Tax=Candidatus Wujingus californicus TaxID=3367618 RepID=UPI001D8A4C91|nr:radical SAM protein [Planctomycetota bacterium]
MLILRAKTIDLFKYQGLTEIQLENSEKNLQEIKNRNLKLNSYPRRLVLELTNACNLNCIMCGRDGGDFKYNFLDIQCLYKLESILNYVEEVTLFGWGEPTIHPKFKDILEFLNKHTVKKYFVTNGTTLAKIKEYLFDYKVDIMAVSLDGATAKTNNMIRKNSNFNQIVSDLKSIVLQKKQEKINYPYINFVFTLMKKNLRELPNMVNLAHSIGLEEVKAVYLTAFNEELKGEVLWGCVDEVRQVFLETIKRGDSLGVKIKLPYVQGEDIAGDKFHKDCYVGWRDFFIGSDGYIRPCQSIAKKTFHISKYENFEEAWNSGEIVNFRSVVNDSKKMWEECKRCYQSSHANWNRETSFLQSGQKFAPDWERR